MAYATLSSKAIGSTIKLKVNGSAKDFIVVHQGKPSSVYDDSCNGTWLLMKDIYEKRQWNSSNTNDYANSTIHSYLNSIPKPSRAEHQESHQAGKTPVPQRQRLVRDRYQRLERPVCEDFPAQCGRNEFQPRLYAER